MIAAAPLAGLTWGRVDAELDAHGAARIEGVLSPEECDGVAGLYDDDEHFRSHVLMARHGFGRGGGTRWA